MDEDRNCHPERSLSQFYRERRSRRTCGLLVAYELYCALKLAAIEENSGLSMAKSPSGETNTK
jgi:hypothetical protein